MIATQKIVTFRGKLSVQAIVIRAQTPVYGSAAGGAHGDE
jgi:hypothetical protein